MKNKISFGKSLLLKNKWDVVHSANHRWFDLNLKFLWKYRYLIWLFVRRDLVTNYKQTILGPLWYLIQPLLSSLLYTFVFTKIMKVSTDGIPPFLFYMAGNVIWTFFANCFSNTSDTLYNHSGIFGKVYFPRLVIPVATVISTLTKFIFNFTIFLLFVLYYKIKNQNAIHINNFIYLTPLLSLQLMILGLGCGILVSSIATKYRDLLYFLQFGLQLWMFSSPVLYPLSQVGLSYRKYYMLNPITPIIEIFKLGFLGNGTFIFSYYIISWIITIIIFIIGIILFNKASKTFTDTV